jgi:STE24 endopeptidase
VFPVLVEPIFNKFTPMPDDPQRAALLELATRDGVPVRDVLVADASRRTTALNAYVSGLGPTRRIVVFDTLLREAPPGEVEAVVAHELGHAKAGDVVTGTAIGALGTAALVCGLYLLGSWSGLLNLAGVDSLTDPRAVALLLALASLAGLVGAPLQSFVSRRIEARADGHALELTSDPATVQTMEQRLATVNLADVDPPPIEFVLFASHPSVVQRLAAARAFARGER